MQKTIVRRQAPAQDIGIQHLLLQRIYAARGITCPADLERSLAGLLPYQDLLGIEQAVACLAQAVMEQKRILIIGDFDVDGATSTALAVRGLRAMGAQYVDYLVPNRFLYGYGLTPEIVAVAAKKKPDILMTVDNGIASHAGVLAAKALGMRVLITDHHLAGSSLPSADAIVNPNQPGDTFSSKNLAGVGVCFYVLIALRVHLQSLCWFNQQNISVPNMAQFLDLVALGTVADVVALDKNNRILVHQGIQRIRAGQCCLGILALLEISKRQFAKVRASDLGFSVAPRLNAAGRLDDMSIGIACLLSDNLEKAKALAMQLDSLNLERRTIEQEMQQQALTALDKLQLKEHVADGLCLFDEQWHQGVIGILAGRLKDRFQRPVIVFAALDAKELKGSARSIPELHIRDILESIAQAHPGMLTKFGGHAMAAGLSLAREHYQTFSKAFNQAVQRSLPVGGLRNTLDSDGELQPQDFTIKLAQLLQEGGPWGQAFPEPLFDGDFKVASQRLVADKHLRLSLSNGMHLLDGIMFNVNTYEWPNQRIEKVRAAFRLTINEYAGQENVQLIIEHLEAL